MTNALIFTTIKCMKVTELKDWDKLTPEEQARLREVYQVDAEDNLPESFTKTMAQKPPAEGGDNA